jgi:hypothetical protein
MKKLHLKWTAYEGSDWFEVYVEDHRSADSERIFVGHPEDFWYEFGHYARKHDLLDVTEEVADDEG